MAKTSAGKYVRICGLWCGSVGVPAIARLPVWVCGYWGESRCLILTDQANVRLQLFNQTRLSLSWLDRMLEEPSEGLQRDTWLTLVLTSAICALGCGIWQVYTRQKVHSKHYASIICPRSFLWETLANSSTLWVSFPNWQPSRASHWFITSSDLQCHRVKSLELFLD